MKGQLLSPKDSKPLGQWLLDHGIKIKTGEGHWMPYSFRGHEYLLEPCGLKREDGRLVEDPLRMDLKLHTVYEKAAQMGLSTFAIAKELKLAIEQCWTIIYYFPTEKHVTKFSTDRFRKMVRKTRYLAEQVQNTDNVHQIFIGEGESSVYFQGMFSKIETRSVDADSLVFDELDVATQEHKESAYERISHSALKRITELSTPTMPNFGIDEVFKTTDLRYWLIKCEHCGTWTNLVREFMEGDYTKVLRITDTAPLGFRACKKCGRPLSLANGQWVATQPGNERVGYQISQLFSSRITVYELLDKFETTKNKAEFYNSKIGVPFVDKESMLTSLGDLWQCVNRNIEWGDKKGGPLIMGVDQGDDCHAVIKKITDSTSIPMKTDIVHQEFIQDDDPFERVGQLMDEYNIVIASMDAGPNHVMAKNLVREFRGRMYIVFYPSKPQKDLIKKMGKEKETESKPAIEDAYTVVVDRNQILELGAERFAKGYEAIPDPAKASMVQVGKGERKKVLNICSDIFFVHLKSLARKYIVIDEETGVQEKKIIYVGGDPHFAHANAYCNTALLLWQMKRGYRMDMDFGEGSDSAFGEMVEQYKQALRILRQRLGKEPTYQQVAQEMGLAEDEWDYIKMVEEYLNDVDLQEAEAALTVPGLRDEDVGLLEVM